MTPFLQFKTGCFGDDQRTLDRLQVICGRLFLFAEPNRKIHGSVWAHDSDHSLES